VIPVGEAHQEPARGIHDRIEAAGYRVDLDERAETVAKRIRDAELEKIPKVIVYGDRESEDALAVRERGGEQSTVGLEKLLAELATL
jgi:threonyl-tRNA synthetase